MRLVYVVYSGSGGYEGYSEPLAVKTTKAEAALYIYERGDYGFRYNIAEFDLDATEYPPQQEQAA